MHCMYVIVELAFIVPSLISKLTKATTKVHTECPLHIYIPFLLGLCLKSKKYVEQVEKSFSEMKGDVGMSHREKEG